jgi:hypothetical protein
MKTLLLSVVLGLICLAIPAYLFFETPPYWPPTEWTTDNLFTTIIFLTMAGVFFLNALLEVHSAGGPKQFLQKAFSSRSTVMAGGKPVGNAITETGLVEDFKYYEAPVGDVNKSVIMFRPDGAKSTRMLVFENNLRDQLPVGRKVTITYRAEGNLNQLLARS